MIIGIIIIIFECRIKLIINIFLINKNITNINEILTIKLFICQMGNNNVCLAEQSVNNLSRKRTPDTKWSREDLKSGSCV